MCTHFSVKTIGFHRVGRVMEAFSVPPASMQWNRQDWHRLAGPSGVSDSRLTRSIVASRRACRSLRKWQTRCGEEPPDWDKEMSLFRQRTMKPNQLETLRKKEAETDVGRVSSLVMLSPF